MTDMYRWFLQRGTHTVTEDGKVINRYTGKEIQHNVTEKGFHRVQVQFRWGSGVKTQWFYVHKLVATAYVRKPSPDYKAVRHIDGDKNNNSAVNLQWCRSLREAVKIAHQKERYDKEKMKTAACKKLLAVDILNNRQIEFNSVLEASLWLSTSGLTPNKQASIRSHLSAVLKRAKPSAYGYMWYIV